MIIAATGHRPNKLGGYSHDALIKLVEFAKINLNADTVISGMALGWDTAVAMAAMEKSIPFIAAIPFESQDKLWPQDSQILYRYLVKHAQKVVYVQPGEYSPWKMMARNRWMVDQADSMLALWNGTSGGTASCVSYATLKNKPINNLWEQWIGFK